MMNGFSNCSTIKTVFTAIMFCNVMPIFKKKISIAVVHIQIFFRTTVRS